MVHEFSAGRTRRRTGDSPVAAPAGGRAPVPGTAGPGPAGLSYQLSPVVPRIRRRTSTTWRSRRSRRCSWCGGRGARSSSRCTTSSRTSCGNDPWFRLATLGLKRADHLIAISDYTKRSLVDELEISPERITVVHHGIDHQRFRPHAYPATPSGKLPAPRGAQVPDLRRHGGHAQRSRHPGARPWRRCAATLPDVALLKVGRAH